MLALAYDAALEVRLSPLSTDELSTVTAGVTDNLAPALSFKDRLPTRLWVFCTSLATVTGSYQVMRR